MTAALAIMPWSAGDLSEQQIFRMVRAIVSRDAAAGAEHRNESVLREIFESHLKLLGLSLSGDFEELRDLWLAHGDEIDVALGECS